MDQDFEIIKQNQLNWRRANKQRLDIFYKQIDSKKVKLLSFIPLLLNHKIGELNNFWFEDDYFGVACYEPDADLYNQLYYKTGIKLDIKIKPAKREILFIALMGSVASFGFNIHSDLDFWIGVGDISPEQKNNLSKKLKVIERWIWDEAHLEVYFFICPIDDLKAERYGITEGESSGSAQGKLLKEEFYRTALIIEGLIPYYYLLPEKVEQKDYQQYVDHLKVNPKFDNGEYIDIGSLYVNNLAEFSGAALWQLAKGMHSPFKSVLKLALLEFYLNGEKFLSETIKDQIQKGKSWPDPYQLLIESLIKFYIELNQNYRKKFIIKCFVLKSLNGHHKSSEAYKWILSNAEKWNLENEFISKSLSFSEWSHDELAKLSKEVLNFFILEYKAIRKHTQGHEQYINEADLSSLGSYLKNTLIPEPNEISNSFTLFDRREIDQLKLEFNSTENKWELFLKLTGDSVLNATKIKTHSNSLYLIFWIAKKAWFHNSITFELKQNLGIQKSEVYSLIEEATNTLESNKNIVIINWLKPSEKYHALSIFVLFKSTNNQWCFESFEGEKSLQNWLSWSLKSQSPQVENLFYGLERSPAYRNKELIAKVKNQYLKVFNQFKLN